MYQVVTVLAKSLQAAAACYALANPASITADAASEPSPESRYVVGSGQVRSLETALRRYEAILERGGWPTVPAGPTIAPGTTDSRLPALAQRLRATGDLSTRVRPTAQHEYGPELQAAVRRFQRRHGLDIDGLVGRRTLAALNVPAEVRVKQLEFNLDRARAASPPGPGLAIIVNIPSYHATLIRAGAETWATRVIVGAGKTPTPQFTSMITEIVLNPRWLVPAKIAAEEMLPILQRDSDFLARGGYILRAADGSSVAADGIDWAALSARDFPYSIVQRPGPRNQLGQVKFVFPNPYGVFLHDTADKRLFSQAERALSHGCIRMQDPLVLAGAILAAEGWTRQAIDDQVAAGLTVTVPLRSPVSIAVLYRTALAGADGTVFFFDDVYSLENPSRSTR